MTIICKLCKYRIQSDKPDALMKTFAQHLGVAHHEHAVELAQVQMRFIGLVGSFLLFSYAEIPRSEPALLASFQENKAEIENILASEPIIAEPAAPIPSNRPVQ